MVEPAKHLYMGEGGSGSIITPLSPSLGILKLSFSPYLRRTVFFTYSLPGLNSSVRVRSSPILCKGSDPSVQVQLSPPQPEGFPAVHGCGWFLSFSRQVLLLQRGMCWYSTIDILFCPIAGARSNRDSWLESKAVSFSLLRPKN